MALKALLFDLDGTLADTEPRGHRPAYNRAFEELGLGWHWSPSLYRELLLQPGGRERIRHYLRSHNPLLNDQHREQVQQDPGRWVEDLHLAKARHFTQLLEAGDIPLRCGVARLIGEAQAQGLKVVIVTNASRRTLEPFLLHSLGSRLRQAVTHVVSGDQVRHKKPAPDLYLRALKLLKLKPGNCVAIEDSAIGLAAADAAGIATLITVNADTRHQDFSRAVLVVSHLGDARHPFTLIQGGPVRSRQVTIKLLQRLNDEHENNRRAWHEVSNSG